jgi:hypothetical protein
MKKPVSTNDVAIVKQFVATFGVQDHTVMFKDLDPATVPLANERANALGLQHWNPRAMNTPGSALSALYQRLAANGAMRRR